MLRVAAVVVSMMLVGCAGYRPSIKSTDTIEPEQAILYGRFFIKAPQTSPLAIDGHPSMGLTYRCDNGEAYTIRFENKESLQGIVIKPGTCRLHEIVYSDADGMLKGRNEVDPDLARSFSVNAGQMAYLGDYSAEYGYSFSFNMGTSTWEVKSLRDNFDESTREFIAKMPLLAKFKPVNAMTM